MAESRPIRLVFDAHAITPDRSGIGAYSFELCRAFIEHHAADIRLHLYVNGAVLAVDSADSLDHAVSHIASGSLYDLRHQLEIPRLVKKGRYDLFHSPDFIVPYLLRGVPIVATIHDLVPLALPSMLAHSKKTRLLPLYRAAVARAARVSARVITDSRFSSEELIRILRVRRSDIDVVPLAPSIRQIAEEVFPARLLSMAEPGKFLLYVGRRDPYKGLALLLQAYARASADGTDNLPPLLLAGPDDARYPLHSLAHGLGIGDRVRYTGYLAAEELSGVLSNALALVFPSLYEGFGFPPLDAMVRGVPVLSSGRGSISEVTGDAALVADPENTDMFASALQRICDDGALRASLAEKGRAQAAQFTWQRTAATTLASYRRALKREHV